MILPKLKKPESPNFSSGPTKKPDEWSVNDLNTNFLGRYHRASDVKIYILKILEKLRKFRYEVLSKIGHLVCLYHSSNKS